MLSKKKSILLSTPTMHTEEIEYIKEAFDRNWVAPLGFNCDAFEKEVVQYLGSSYHALCLNSGTAALHLAVKLAGVKRGDKVFCSDMTFAATANPITYEGGIPVFIDSERETWNMDPIALDKAFSKHPETKVVMLAQLYGTPAKMDEILAVCEKHGAVLIEDAAEAIASEYKGRKCGDFGKYSVLSFNGNKLITTSGGGMLLCETKADCDKALFLATQAREKVAWYQHKEIGYNYRMSNVVAGIGRGQLLHVDEHRELKVQVYKRYAEGLKSLPVTMNPYLEGSVPNFWLSCITVDDGCNVNPLDIMRVLGENNVEARPLWKPMHMQPVFKGCEYIKAGGESVDEDLFKRGLCLPSDIKMTVEEQDYVIDLIKSCF